MDSLIDCQDISSLVSTNRHLIQTKRQKTLQKIDKYSDKIQHLTKLINSCSNPKQKDYLRSQFTKTLLKKQTLQLKVSQIDQIQLELQKYEDKQNQQQQQQTFTLQNTNILEYIRVIIGLYDDLNSNKSSINSLNERYVTKYQLKSNNEISFQEVMEDIISIIKNGTENAKQYQVNANKRQKQFKKQINELLKIFQIDYHIQNTQQIKSTMKILKQQKRKNNQYKTLEKYSDKLYTKQKQLKSVQQKYNQILNKNSKLEQTIQVNTKKIQKINSMIIERGKVLEQKQKYITKLALDQSKLEQKHQKMIEIQITKKNRLQEQKERISDEISKSIHELKQLEMKYKEQNQQIRFKETKILKLKQQIGELKEQRSRYRLENQQIKEKIIRKSKQLIEIDKQYKINQTEFYRSKDSLKEIKEQQQKLREKYQEFMKTVLESKTQYEQLMRVLTQNHLKAQEQQSTLTKLRIQKQEIQEFILNKNNQLQELHKQIQQFNAHKVQIESQFQQIQERKRNIFKTIIEKQQFNHKLQESKNNLEYRINCLEQQSMKYNKLFKEYNETIQKISLNIQKLKGQEKIIGNSIDELQDQENEIVKRIQKLQKVQIREGIKSIPDGLCKDGIERVYEKVGNYDVLERRLKEVEAEARKLKLENHNLKVLSV